MLARWGKIALVFALLFAVAGVIYRWRKDHSPNRDDAKLIEVRAVVKEIPPCSHCVLIHSDSGSSDISAGITNTYEAAAPCVEVREYYQKLLAGKGWILSRNPKDEPFSTDKISYERFQRGDIAIDLQYDRSPVGGEKSCHYSVDFTWWNK